MFDSLQQRELALGFGLAFKNWPTPTGAPEIDESDRVYVWGSYLFEGEERQGDFGCFFGLPFG